uniref:Fungal lipase-type domain-containing protein n=1 Tax=Aegilops tauschii TaxID=37682 RepID=R7WFQ3_AEGTA
MAPLSCRDLSAQLSSLPHRATAATTTHTQISLRRAPAPRAPLTTAKRLQLPSAATRDDALASLVGQLEQNLTQDEEEDDLYLPDDASSARRRAAQKHQDELPARLGSVLAILSAYDIAESAANLSNGKRAAVCVYSFSGPRVGNGRFRERFEGELGVKALRVTNVHDNVPRMPGIFLNEGVPEMVRRVAEGLRMPWCYSHVGVELALDHKRSPFLKDTLDPGCSHNLEAHLHLLDGGVGSCDRCVEFIKRTEKGVKPGLISDRKESALRKVIFRSSYGERFVLASGRDPALVNKASDFLKDHHCVPPFWRQDENKGMVRAPDGRWIQPDRRGHLDDDHHHDGHHVVDGDHHGHFRLFRQP